jgi:hypothetical protein
MFNSTDTEQLTKSGLDLILSNAVAVEMELDGNGINMDHLDESTSSDRNKDKSRDKKENKRDFNRDTSGSGSGEAPSTMSLPGMVYRVHDGEYSNKHVSLPSSPQQAAASSKSDSDIKE